MIVHSFVVYPVVAEDNLLLRAYSGRHGARPLLGYDPS